MYTYKYLDMEDLKIYSLIPHSKIWQTQLFLVLDRNKNNHFEH